MKERNITEFFDNDFRQFSFADIHRSIPDLVDGLKPSTRKVLYTGIKKGLVGENNKIKVSTFSGSIQETCSYHHGEMSLHGAIVGMAQNFTGANNLNLFEPKGMFGTRRKGGKDSSAPRYLFTYLSPLCEKIFLKQDEDLLEYLFDDGQAIEPVRFYPIIPMVLVNGAEGIGTGWSTKIPCYNPLDIILWFKNRINKKRSNIEITPWYNNFIGTVEKITETQWATIGKYEKINTNKIKIVELPIGTWTDKYLEHLNDLIDKGDIKNYRIISNGEGKIPPTFEIDLTRELLKTHEDNNTLIDFLNLRTLISTTNMYLMSGGKIKSYETIYDICEEFYTERLSLYEKRKIKNLATLEENKNRIKEVARFINLVINDKILINKRPKNDIIRDIETFNFIKINESFDYLLSLPIWSLTKEQEELYKKRVSDAELEYDTLKNTPIEDIWLKELQLLEKNLK